MRDFDDEDGDLEEAYGPEWEAVTHVIRRASILIPAEINVIVETASATDGYPAAIDAMHALVYNADNWETYADHRDQAMETMHLLVGKVLHPRAAAILNHTVATQVAKRLFTTPGHYETCMRPWEAAVGTGKRLRLGNDRPTWDPTTATNDG
jgi:hypothetical protein